MAQRTIAAILMGLALAASFLTMAAPPAVAQTEDPALVIVGNQEVVSGDIVWVTVALAPSSTPVAAISLTLTFDATKLQPILNAQNQPACMLELFCGPTGPTTAINAVGLTTPGWSTLTDLVAVPFTAIGSPTTTPVTVAINAFADELGNTLPAVAVSGLVTIVDEPEPDPDPEPEPTVPSISLTAMCIDNPTLLALDGVDKLAVGDSFAMGSALYYLVTGDDFGCKINCLGGFDANCDGRLHDYCPIEERNTVAGVRHCMASTSTANESP